MKQLLIFSLLILVVQIVQADIYHVATSGNDSNPGTAASPWKTIARANSTLRAGDTVLIHAGIYSEQIRPVNSGFSDTQRIVYRAAGDGDVVLDTFVWSKNYGGKGLIALGGKEFVTVSGKSPGGVDSDRFIKLRPTNKTEIYGNFTGSTGCVVENITMERGARDIGPGRGWAFGDYWYKGLGETKFNVLRKCEIYGYVKGNNAAEYTEDTVTLANAHHNLIDNCYIGGARHVALNQNAGTTYKNVFRNNIVVNTEHTAMSLYGFAEATYRQDHHLIENNTLRASGEKANRLGPPGNALQFAAFESIVRYNVITESGSKNNYDKALAGVAMSAGSQARKMHDNRFYHNTIVHNMAPAVGLYTFGSAQAKGRNRFWNNFLYDGLHPNGGKLLVRYWRSQNDGLDRWVMNVFGQLNGSELQRAINLGGTDEAVKTVAGKYTNPSDPDFSAWSGYDNVYDSELDKTTFVDYSNKKYQLGPNSPYIDTAAPLTMISTKDSGSGTSLIVNDSRVFYGEASEFPVWMGVNNDWMAIGSNPGDVGSARKVQIASVDDATNTIVILQPVKRSAGEYVWLWKDSDGTPVITGSAPDIGAFEYSSGVKPTATGKSAPTIKAAPNPPQLLN